MASPLGHGLGAYALWVTVEPQRTLDPRQNRIILGASLLFGSMADADFLVAHFTRLPFLQHHYFSHTIAFTVFVFGICYAITKMLGRENAFRTALLLGMAYGTHLILDYFTADRSAPYGIPLFWPLTSKHFVAPLEIFDSIQRGSFQALLGARNVWAILREVLVLGPVAWLAFRRAQKRARFLREA